MNIPNDLLKALQEAIEAIDKDIETRKATKQSAQDLEKMKQEMTEVIAGKRKQISKGLQYIIVDSMDWNQPCLKAFNRARELMRRYFGESVE